MAAILIGYARCSTDKQDLEANRQILLELGVAADDIYLGKAYSGTNRDWPGLDQALAATRAGDTLVTPKLDRLARSVPDARQIGDSLAARNVRLQLGTMIYDPTDPMGKMFFNILATFAEFEVDLLRMRTREGMAIAKPRESSKAGHRSCRRPVRRTYSSSTPPRSTPSPSWLSCSRCPAPRCTASSNATGPQPAPRGLMPVRSRSAWVRRHGRP